MTHDHLMINLGMSQDMREKKVMVMKIRAMPAHRRRKKGRILHHLPIFIEKMITSYVLIKLLICLQIKHFNSLK